MLVHGLKLPSSARVGALAPAEELRDTVLCAPEEEPGPCTAVSGPPPPQFLHFFT